MRIAWRVGELVRARHRNACQPAERAGIDVKAARNIITGRATRVDLETIGRLADALDVVVRRARGLMVDPGPGPCDAMHSARALVVNRDRVVSSDTAFDRPPAPRRLGPRHGSGS
jgi:predicted nucleic acid-binding protein